MLLLFFAIAACYLHYAVFRCSQCFAAAAFWFRVLLATVEHGCVTVVLHMRNLTKKVAIAYLLRKKQQEKTVFILFSKAKKKKTFPN